MFFKILQLILSNKENSDIHSGSVLPFFLWDSLPKKKDTSSTACSVKNKVTAAEGTAATALCPLLMPA